MTEEAHALGGREQNRGRRERSTSLCLSIRHALPRLPGMSCQEPLPEVIAFQANVRHSCRPVGTADTLGCCGFQKPVDRPQPTCRRHAHVLYVCPSGLIDLQGCLLGGLGRLWRSGRSALGGRSILRLRHYFSLFSASVLRQHQSPPSLPPLPFHPCQPWQGFRVKQHQGHNHLVQERTRSLCSVASHSTNTSQKIVF